MAYLRFYNAYGQGANLVATGPTIPNRDPDVRPAGRTFLGNEKYFEYFKVSGNDFYDRVTIKTNYGFDPVHVEGFAYFNDGEVTLEIRGFSVSVRKIFSKGEEVILAGGDSIFGNKFSDVLHGFSGNDKVSGGAGSDRLFGDSGSDDLIGGKGDDRISGGKGSDRLHGEEGADWFLFNRDSGRDRIVDFENGVDRIQISEGPERFGGIQVQKSGSDTILSFNDVTIVLEDVSRRQIDATDFIFS